MACGTAVLNAVQISVVCTRFAHSGFDTRGFYVSSGQISGLSVVQGDLATELHCCTTGTIGGLGESQTVTPFRFSEQKAPAFALKSQTVYKDLSSMSYIAIFATGSWPVAC